MEYADIILSEWENERSKGNKDYCPLGLTLDEFFSPFRHKNVDFWINLKEYEWFEELYNELKKLSTVVFLSSTGNSPYAAYGKTCWLQNKFGKDFNNYILTTQKYRLANDNSILIDDYSVFIDEFKEAGGKTILFPLFNSEIKDKVKYTIDKVKKIIKTNN